MDVNKSLVRRSITIWLILGIVLIYFQVIIGGITRLTGSGLSITKWEIVIGTLPPLSNDAWNEVFDLYKETPQYQKINEGMTMSSFKFIYFWEYLHRLWARSMGFVFIVPFLVFWKKGWLSKVMMRKLLVVFFMAGLVGLFGWIMVASGLIERPWVNAYKLAIHLSLALVVLGYLLWVFLQYRYPREDIEARLPGLKYFLVAMGIQIFLGGIMSGAKASLVYPEWPDYGGSWLPAVLLERGVWNVDNFVNYDSSPFLAGLIQICHRSLAYILIISGIYILIKHKRLITSDRLWFIPGMLVTMLITQAVLGILVLYGSKSTVPVFLGIAHQVVAIAILLCTIIIYYFSDRSGRKVTASI
ncbi:MAG: COX15/CtaA family protein [Saprospiraceae bacterium]|nr:COX15/CtaA family protein [Saprospiraceae bacterium]